MAGGEVKAADERTATPAAGCAAEDSNDLVDSSAPPEITARLSKGFVDWILNRKWVAFDEDPDDFYHRMINDPDRPEFYTPEYLEEERETMREMIAANKRARESFEKFQEWVRRQLDEKGYVEVGEAHIAQCVRNRQSVTAEHWRALMGGLMGELKLDEDEEEDQVTPGAGAGGITVESN